MRSESPVVVPLNDFTLHKDNPISTLIGRTSKIIPSARFLHALGDKRTAQQSSPLLYQDLFSVFSPTKQTNTFHISSSRRVIKKKCV